MTWNFCCQDGAWNLGPLEIKDVAVLQGRGEKTHVGLYPVQHKAHLSALLFGELSFHHMNLK